MAKKKMRICAWLLEKEQDMLSHPLFKFIHSLKAVCDSGFFYFNYILNGIMLWTTQKLANILG